MSEDQRPCDTLKFTISFLQKMLIDNVLTLSENIQFHVPSLMKNL